MKKILNRKRSIYTQLLLLLIISAIMSGVLFFFLQILGSNLISNCLSNTDYVENQNSKFVSKLQTYIDDNNLSSKDTSQIKSWVEEQSILNVQIYKDNIQIFDSSYPDQEIWEAEIEAVDYDWISYQPISFSDGSADIIISGIYEYQLNNYSLIISIALSFLLFLVLVLLGMRKKMAYIKKLSEEIEILEGGQLDYEITVKGNDELAHLAKGLDDMRLSFRNLMRSEAEIVAENQRIVTEMSHDIRTPITSIMLYTEILKKDELKNETETQNYIEKIDQKAKRLKQLTDNLFEYSLTSSEKEIELEEAEDVEVIFFDLFSETCNYLNQQGFEVDFRVNFPNGKLRISSDYLMRIMDNITSNIIKYADRNSPIRIYSLEQQANIFGFAFENKISFDSEKAESTGIGLKSIENMIRKMNGSCISETQGDNFRICLYFSLAE